MTTIVQRLTALQDKPYRQFQAKLIPTLPPERIIGVRMPAIRALAKELRDTDEAATLMATLPHDYYEEYLLHGCWIAQIRDTAALLEALERFLPFVDNWAVCDCLTPKAFARHEDAQLKAIRRWLDDRHPYTVRFGIRMLMQFYLDDTFDPVYPAMVANVRSGHYYVQMMQAWYFATALAKRYDAVIPYLQNKKLPPWIHNKTIQKAVESYRITPRQKEYLRTLRLKPLTSPKALKTPRLILRKARPEDLDAIWQNVWRDESIADQMLWRPTRTRDEAIDRLERTMAYQAQAPAYFVCLKATGEPIGFAGIWQVEDGVFEDSGICVAAAHQNQGYGKEILAALLGLAFDRLKAHGFIYSCFQENARSAAVCKAFGFAYTHSQNGVRQWDGHPYISDCYRLDKDGWQTYKNTGRVD
jgi:RimJ/RimL family protein N-acetyltransferase/3-methyladenine DNA glycosylase AlkD